MIIKLCADSDTLFLGGLKNIVEVDKNLKIKNVMGIQSPVRHMLLFNGKLKYILQNKVFGLALLPKKSTDFIEHQGKFFVSDKSGDIYEATSGHLKLLLGHVSIVTKILFKDNKIYSCDKDRKIRVTHYPNTQNIDYFCLGHTDYISTMDFYQDFLISAGGKDEAYIWKESNNVGKIPLPFFKTRKLYCMDNYVVFLPEERNEIYIYNFQTKSGFLKILPDSPLDCCSFINFLVISQANDCSVILLDLEKDTIRSLLIAELEKGSIPHDLAFPSKELTNKFKDRMTLNK
eukprot:NODE_798_length_3838_cov_0.446911.p3 type:complete len:289 gc:universal NODE_798_length_3838_cov_0.446911:1417-2283(+)